MFRREKTVASVATLIGKSTRIQGDLEFAGGLHLDGAVAGHVRSLGGPEGTLSVSEEGCIEGSVDVPQVVLNGTVKGDIRAIQRVVLGSKARVEGNVWYGIIEMAMGAEIRGRLIPNAPAAAPSGLTPSEAAA